MHSIKPKQNPMVHLFITKLLEGGHTVCFRDFFCQLFTFRGSRSRVLLGGFSDFFMTSGHMGNDGNQFSGLFGAFDAFTLFIFDICK